MTRRLLAGGKSFQPSSIDEEYIEPAVIVIIVKGDAAPGSLEQVFVFVFAAEDRFGVQACFASYIEKRKAEAWRRVGQRARHI